MTLLIVIVNYRTPDLTIACLRSLEAEVAMLPGTRVVVVENGSGDGSAAAIGGEIERRGWGWAALVDGGTNAGFAGGNNLGMRAGGRARYTLLLNSDTVAHTGCLRGCHDLMEREPDIGVMSCKLLNADGSVQNVTRRFPTPPRMLVNASGLTWKLPRLFGWADTEDPGWDRATEARDVEWIGGAFMFIRDGVLERVGGLDEDFFFYGEDVEFCHRVRRAGYRCRYDPAMSITHLGGASSDPARLPGATRSVHAWRARYLVQRKCYGRVWAAAIRGLDVASCGVRVCLLRAAGRHGGDRYRDLRGMLRLLTRRLEAAA